MTAFFFGLLHAVVDILRAAWHMLTRQQHATYAATGLIRAPHTAVWDLLNRHDLTYAASGLRMHLQPIEGRENCYIGHLSVNGRPAAKIGIEFVAVEPPTQLVTRYLPEFSDRPGMLGEDDILTINVEDAGQGHTRLSTRRELTHKVMATRITTPIGLRNMIHMVRGQAELEAGIASVRLSLRDQVFWTLAAFASFWWLLGVEVAAILMVVIAVHEAGHALAMWRYGLGVGFVSFVPFLGGVAAPKRLWTTEWQRGIVALMGVGFSLPITAGLVYASFATGRPEPAHAAVWFAIINAVNLIPFPGIDGGVVVAMLLRKVHPLVSQFVAWAMFALFVALAVWLNDPLVWAGVVFSLIALVQGAALKMDAHLTPMRWPSSFGLLVIYLGLCAGYALVAVMAMTFDAGRFR